MYPWGLNHSSISRAALEDELIKHEHRMVGSELKWEKYIKKDVLVGTQHKVVRKYIPMAAGFISENDAPTLAQWKDEDIEIPVRKTYLMEKITEHKWNKYTGLDEWKFVSDTPLWEI
jgi:hypothetical protein